jgi:SAM-dependent methyltransferase
MMAARLRRWLAPFRATPLHPQWLLDRREPVPAVLRSAHGRLLDVGCADRWLERALPRGWDYLGLDHPSIGGARYAAQPDVFADAARLPFRDESFSAVAALDVVEHLPDPLAALRVFHRVLAAGGWLWLSIPFLYPVHDAPHDFQRYTRPGLERLLLSAGFEVEVCEARTPTMEAAALIGNLAIAGTVVIAWQRRRLAFPLALLLLPLVPLLNLSGWLLARLLPSWDALVGGYRVLARKRCEKAPSS